MTNQKYIEEIIKIEEWYEGLISPPTTTVLMKKINILISKEREELVKKIKARQQISGQSLTSYEDGVFMGRLLENEEIIKLIKAEV